ncbi:MAG: calcium:proton antiporter [Phycisphaerae bacterium]|nr:calcium:proton antiporter [Phycisphaerae bacterium]
MNSLIGFLRHEKSLIIGFLSLVAMFFLAEPIRENLSSITVLAVVFAWLFFVILSAAINVVHHAECLAHRYGEPYGTLILTLSVIGIEVIMITTVMLNAKENPTMGRDTMYSVLMIVMNGLIGVALVAGAFKHREQGFNVRSFSTYMSCIIVVCGLGFYMPLVVPANHLFAYEVFLVFACLCIYGIFLRIQTVEHRSFFVYESSSAPHEENEYDSSRGGLYHGSMLLLTMIPIILLAKSLAIVIDEGLLLVNAPPAIAGLIVAILILSPEGLTAVRAARRNEMQRVINISLGSGLATVGLTIPVLLVVSLMTGQTLELGLDGDQAILLLITVLSLKASLSDAKTNVLEGMIHFILFIAFVLTLFVID